MGKASDISGLGVAWREVQAVDTVADGGVRVGATTIVYF